MSALLSVSGLHTVVDTEEGPLHAVDGLDFDIFAGECLALVGESGCGKSFTALSLMRLLPEAGRIVDGRVEQSGRELLALPEAVMRSVRGRKLAMIFQEPATALNPVMTVGRQIIEVIERHGTAAKGEARERAIELLASVGVPEPQRRLDEYPFQLSGGLKQRVMIAAALAGEPEVLIADEPTTALDVTIQAQILDLLRGLQARRGMAILLITHDLGVVAQMAQRIAVMYAGQIVEIAESVRFFRGPRHPYSQRLLDSLPSPGRRHAELAVIPGQVPPLTVRIAGCRFAERCDRAFERCRTDAPELRAPEPGLQMRCHLEDSSLRGAGAPPAEAQVARFDAGNEVLRCTDMAVHYPVRKGLLRRIVARVRAVDGISLALHEGRTLALVGESGCGKTTAGKALLQLIRPTAGRVTYRASADSSFELNSLSTRDLRGLRAGLQIVFQDPYSSLDPRMRILEVLDEGMASLGIGGERAQRHARIAELLEQVGLPDQAMLRYPHEFSGGQRQRIAIARALSVNPRLIVCDEPTSALDVSVQAQILNLLRGLQRRHGLAYLFITHNLSIVDYFAHDVAVMYLGRIVERGSVDEVLRTPRHPYTQALLSAVPRIEGAREVIRLQGDPPSALNPPSGCHFHPRCAQATDACRGEYPASRAVGATQEVSCVLYPRRAP